MRTPLLSKTAPHISMQIKAPQPVVIRDYCSTISILPAAIALVQLVLLRVSQLH